jgi:ParB-like chromosome segregation protein Spo0J
MNFPKNIRDTSGSDDSQLRASLEAFGWKELFPAIEDQDGKVLVGHRRLKIAKELKIDPVIRTVKCKNDKERWEIAIASNVGHEQMAKADRVRIAQRMYTDGTNLTQVQIAAVLGVSRTTITSDLSNLSGSDKLKPVKTARNPKGAGRPKGSKKPRNPATKPRSVTPEIEQSIGRAVLDEGKTREQAAREFGYSVQVAKIAVNKEEARRQAQAEPPIDRSMLSPTAQQKFDAAVRQYQAKLDSSFERRVEEEIRKRIDQIILPHWKEKIEQSKKLFERRRGLMERETFNSIRRALHPDSRQSISDRKLSDAFDQFMTLEKYLLDEKNSPTDLSGLPDSWADWEEAKRKATAERHAARRRGESRAVRRQ